jgi:hypothetical protein
MKRKPWLKLAIATIAVFEIGIARSSYALVPVSWSDASADNTWENAANWVPALEPTNNTFDVEIGLVSTAACNLSSGFEIDALTLSNSNATLNLVPGALLAFTNNVINNGTIVVDKTAANVTTALRFDANAAITGSGSILLNGFGSSFNVADFNINSSTVTIGANQTIHGRGTILGGGGSILINNGTINGDDASGNNMQLDLVNTANQNNALIEATNGGVLGLYSGSIDQTGGGTFLASGANSLIQLGGGAFATVTGGILNTANGGVIAANGAGVGLVGCTNNGNLQIPPNNIIVVTGSGLTNNSTITVNNGTNVTTAIRFDASGQLGGTGTVLLNGFGSTFNVADFNINSSTVTIGANQIIHGRGTILGGGGSILINNGTINGDDASGNNMQLDLVNTANQNNALIEATNGGVLGLYSGSIDQTGGGTFLASGANSSIQLGGGAFATVTGGILNTANGGVIAANGAGVGLVGCTNNGVVQIPGGNIITVSGTGLTNNGTVLVDTNADNTTTQLRFDADGTLGGSGSVKLNGIVGSFNVADFNCNGHNVINGANHTIQGNGDIFMNGGTLTNNGIITPGLSPGQLDYSGTLTLGSTSNLVFEIGGTTQVTQYDLLNKIDGAAQTLGGNLVVRLINNFTPASSDTFTILTTQTTLQGAFSNVASGGHLATADGHGIFTVTYSGQNNVVLSQFTPTAPTSKIVTLSTRAQAEDIRQIITTSFVIGGTDRTTVLVRALGSSLGLSPYLKSPTIQVQDSNGRTVAANDDWKALQQAQIQATGLAPTSDEESAVLVTIPPGSYTATLRGEVKGNTGVAKFDIHDLSPNANSKFNSMSGLGFLAGGETVVGDFSIANPVANGTSGFTVNTGGKVNVLIRALGPSFGGLADPTLELDKADGTRIFFNDNWQDSQKSQIQATGMAPTNPNESAIVANLDPGDYIAVVRGKVTGTGRRARPASGFVRVEVYQLEQPNN